MAAAVERPSGGGSATARSHLTDSMGLGATPLIILFLPAFNSFSYFYFVYQPIVVVLLYCCREHAVPAVDGLLFVGGTCLLGCGGG